MKIKYYYKLVADLAKIRISVSVTFTVLVGYILAKGRVDIESIYSLIGVFLLSCGSSAFNHFQEWKFDKLMNRTKFRPIPSENMLPNQVFALASIFALSGLYVLLVYTNIEAFLLGVSALVLYNVIYTPAKRITSLAVIPGAFIGSIPPMVGYAAAGGDYLSMEILALAIFIFIWQMPHFWLLLLIYDEDYKRADYPTLTQFLTLEQLKRITYSWLLGLVASGILISYFAAKTNKIELVIIFFVLGCILAYKTKYITNLDTDFIGYKKAFKIVNYYVLAVITILTLNRLIF